MQKYLTSEEVDRRKKFIFLVGNTKILDILIIVFVEDVINRDRRRKGMRRGGGRKKEGSVSVMTTRYSNLILFAK